MTRAISLTLVLLATTAALPAAAQDSGGLRLRGNPIATLDQIEADTSRGCPLSSTSVTVGVNKAFGTGSSATQGLRTVAGSTGNSGCRPLVTTGGGSRRESRTRSGLASRPVDQRPRSARGAGQHQLHPRDQHRRRRRVGRHPTHTEPDLPVRSAAHRFVRPRQYLSTPCGGVCGVTSGAGHLQKMPAAKPAARVSPRSRQRSRSAAGMIFGARIASGVCARVRTINGSATVRRRHPVVMRAICRAAFSPSLPAQISVAYGRPLMRSKDA
jgi:hypothetical protein